VNALRSLMTESRASIVAFDRRAAAALSAYADSGAPDVDYRAVQRAMTRARIDRRSKIPGDARAKLERVEAQAAAAG